MHISCMIGKTTRNMSMHQSCQFKKMHVKPFRISSRVVIIGLKVFLPHKNKEGEGLESQGRGSGVRVLGLEVRVL